MKTILVAGSKNLESDRDAKRLFAEKIGAAIVKEPGWRLITGGAKGGSEKDEKTGGIDFHAALGAQKALKDPLEEREKIFTLHPREKRKDLFRIGYVSLGRAKSTQARRFELISRADAAIIIEGHAGSVQIIEYCIAADKPVLPLACFGKASLEAWKPNPDGYRENLVSHLKLDENSTQFDLIQNGSKTPDALLNVCMDILRKLLRPSCFVAMPYQPKHSESLWNQILKPVIEEAELFPQRADFVHNVGQIIDDIKECIEESAAVIADVTGANPNVMYELGYAHAMKKPTIIICNNEDKIVLEKELPFDIRGIRIFPFNPWKQDQFRQNLLSLLKSLSCRHS